MIKEEHKDLTPIELALLTWYEPDNPLYKESEHPTIKLAGEVGELLDLWAKDKYKPNFSWWNCKNCKTSKGSHFIKNNIQYCSVDGTKYTPFVLDELGDVWYYLRILAWIYDVELKLPKRQYQYDNLILIKAMYYHANRILQNSFIEESLLEIFNCLFIMLSTLNISIEDLTLLNYQKLVLDETNHGWKDAR